MQVTLTAHLDLSIDPTEQYPLAANALITPFVAAYSVRPGWPMSPVGELAQESGTATSSNNPTSQEVKFKSRDTLIHTC